LPKQQTQSFGVLSAAADSYASEDLASFLWEPAGRSGCAFADRRRPNVTHCIRFWRRGKKGLKV
jgi:hypothetical protein